MTKELAQLKRGNETGKGRTHCQRLHRKLLTAENMHKQKDVCASMDSNIGEVGGLRYYN